MPRNRYAKLVRASERAQIAHQEKALADLERELHANNALPAALSIVDEAKENRRARLEQKRRHKPAPAVIAASA